jgi:Zn-dependent M28 family amino/carboxypeptidase
MIMVSYSIESSFYPFYISGSGSAANLGLAVGLARLFQTSTYAKYKYRIRFCWWGAEELGLLGSADHVRQAKVSTVIGERLSDYLINLNYDMLGSPNYIFGIYDGRTANNATPSQALPGSNKITALFKGWFDQQKLPWDYTDFSGRSDYGPFLAEGIVAGGLFSGADETKTQAQRDRYDQMLGQGMGGIAGAIQDPCYHRACDSIQNINIFAYERMVQAAAYVLEYLARQDDLNRWLYPPAEIQRLSTRPIVRREYNSINEFFGLPYL